MSRHRADTPRYQVVCRKGAYEKIIAAIENMVELDVPFRFNCTMSAPVVPILPEIARKSTARGRDMALGAAKMAAKYGAEDGVNHCNTSSAPLPFAGSRSR